MNPTTAPVIFPKFFSRFRDAARDLDWLQDWVSQVEKQNGRTYAKKEIKTSLGNTQVYGLNESGTGETLIIFPGARTSVLFWDLDKNLDNLTIPLRIFMVETNGLPNLSDSHTPDVHSLGYGDWANEVLEQLGINKAHISGASFGGLVCMKLAITNPEKILSASLLNPGCLQPFSLSVKNLYFNLLPIIRPTQKNIQLFLSKAVFDSPTHALSTDANRLVLDYEEFALTRFIDKTQKPYFMNDELKKVRVPTHLIVGNKDLLFPFERSIANARKLIPSLKSVDVFENVGHGIETYGPAIEKLSQRISGQ